MVAVPEVCAEPVAVIGATAQADASRCRRLVAIVDTAMELLRPESDLLRIIAGVSHVDLLVASIESPPGATPLHVISAPPSSAVDHRAELLWTADLDPYSDLSTEGTDDVDDVEDAHRGEVDAEVARLGLPGLHVHHLDLRPPLGPGAEDDLVAALSELVGFDPEPGVYCLAPAATPNDLAHAPIATAAQRIARIYGLPLLRYRCLELAVVPGQRAGDED
jgi:hypothetical protein